MSAERKKLQKAALGLVDSDEEDPNEDVSCGSNNFYCLTKKKNILAGV